MAHRSRAVGRRSAYDGESAERGEIFDSRCLTPMSAGMSSLSMIYCPVGSPVEATELGRQLVTERLAGCANVLTGMISIYPWDGEIQQSSEAVLLLKTRTTLLPELRARLRVLHQYDCPAIVSWELTGVNAEYEQWINQETTPPFHSAGESV